INPVPELVARAHAVGALVHVDAAQSVPHLPVDVQELDCDFLSFSSHKMCGPTGFGIFWGRKELLLEMPPFLGGGEMISVVTLDRGSTWADLPHKFEAGTPAIAEAVGFGAALDFLSDLGMENVRQHEVEMTSYAMEALSEVPDLRFLGPTDAKKKGGVATFMLKGVHPHDIAATLDEEGIAIRAGHHCAQPLHERFGIPASARASFYLYNEPSEVDALVVGLARAQKLYAL
ncbi:MAG: aminotransferase class V-fold PLP-dependent enzyme, partial [Ardenticatenaceae bacterium]